MVRAAISKMELNFTETERKIATFFLENAAEAVSMSSSDVAKRIGVSQSAIIKFVKKIGFDGFVDFKMNLYDSDERGRKAVSTAFGAQGASLDEPLANVIGASFSSSIESLRQTYENLDMANVSRAVQMIEDAQRIYICGKGTSFLVASDLASKLMKFGLTVICVEDLDTVEVSSGSARPGDVYIAFSYSGESKELIRILSKARRGGASTLVVTKNVQSSIAELADLRIDIITEEPYFRAASMSSRMAFCSIVDALFLGVFKNDLVNRQKKLAMYESDVLETE